MYTHPKNRDKHESIISKVRNRKWRRWRLGHVAKHKDETQELQATHTPELRQVTIRIRGSWRRRRPEVEQLRTETKAEISKWPVKSLSSRYVGRYEYMQWIKWTISSYIVIWMRLKACLNTINSCQFGRRKSLRHFSSITTEIYRSDFTINHISHIRTTIKWYNLLSYEIFKDDVICSYRTTCRY